MISVAVGTEMSPGSIGSAVQKPPPWIDQEALTMDAIQTLLAEREIAGLVNDFNFLLDHGRYEELAALFTVDGEFDRLGEVLRGRDAILACYRKRHPYLTRHVTTNLRFTRLDESEADATMYVADFIGQPLTNHLPVLYQLPQPILLEFDDTYSRTDSCWRIHRRRATIVMKSAD